MSCPFCGSLPQFFQISNDPRKKVQQDSKDAKTLNLLAARNKGVLSKHDYSLIGAIAKRLGSPSPLETSKLVEEKKWNSIEDSEPPEDTKLLTHGYAYNDPEKGTWNKVLFFIKGKWYEDKKGSFIWKGYPPTHWLIPK